MMDRSREEDDEGPLPAWAAAPWEGGGAEPDGIAFVRDHPELSRPQKLAILLDDQRRRWESGRPLSAGSYLEAFADLADDPNLRAALVAGEIRARGDCPRGPSLDELDSRFVELREMVAHGWLGRRTLPSTIADESGAGGTLIAVTERWGDLEWPDRGADPAFIGRYRVVNVLGEGGFGRVYLARDESLDRWVAIKVPHPSRSTRPQDVEAFLDEARNVARLDHDGIVPVYDVGKTAEGLGFVVSRRIDGTSLGEEARALIGAYRRVCVLVATVAEALHHAHRKGLVHRDVKPGNILIDAQGNPFLTDFGLALKNEDFGTGSACVGTPAYMSPEQAAGAGDRVDGRTDIFSLGLVLHELLTGRHPYQGGSRATIKDRIATQAVRPPREFDEALPEELERICLKALAHHASDRYSTAKDFADDLRRFAEATAPSPGPARGARSDATPEGSSHVLPNAADPRRYRLVPRGLRPFESADAGAFLKLLPGARDRRGLPDSIRFWKARIDNDDPEGTFRVGLLHGPSGCGKSSLVQAGLVPRLGAHVLSVVVAAERGALAGPLLRCLQAELRAPRGSGLAVAFDRLRGATGLTPATKVLVVLDQFERWLAAGGADAEPELVEALARCDGSRLQCLVVVRDDSWLAASRFLTALGVRPIDGETSMGMDLLTPKHARRLLAAFGEALGALHENDRGDPPAHERFLDGAIAVIAQGGKVVPSRLALFTEAVARTPWTRETLEAVSLTGLGVTLIEETCSTSTAALEPGGQRAATRAVLGVLLPDEVNEACLPSPTRRELRAAAGLDNAPEAFDSLLHLLEDSRRIVSPTRTDGDEAAPEATRYQLTHDCLVPPIREWLERETAREQTEPSRATGALPGNADRARGRLRSVLEWLEVFLAP